MGVAQDQVRSAAGDTVTMVRRDASGRRYRLIHTTWHPAQVPLTIWAKIPSAARTRRTACGKDISRRYVAGVNWSRHGVNCRACLLALVDALTFSQFLHHVM